MADCERFHEGLLAEPVNALSSLAYVAAGVYVWRHNRVQGGALVAVGVGSFAYHGTGGAAAHAAHDVSIVLVAATVAVALPRIRRGALAWPALAAASAAAMALALPLQLLGRTGGRLCDPDALLQAHAGWHALTATALAGACTLAARGAVRSAGAVGAS